MKLGFHSSTKGVLGFDTSSSLPKQSALKQSELKIAKICDALVWIMLHICVGQINRLSSDGYNSHMSPGTALLSGGSNSHESRH